MSLRFQIQLFCEKHNSAAACYSIGCVCRIPSNLSSDSRRKRFALLFDQNEKHQ